MSNKVTKVQQMYEGYKITFKNNEGKESCYRIFYELLNFTQSEFENYNKAGGYYAVYIENYVLEATNISHKDKLIYIMIKAYINKHKVAFPSIEHLEECTGQSHTTIIDSINNLVSHGYIKAERSRRRENDKRFNHNNYYFNLYDSSVTFVPFCVVFSIALNITEKMLYIFLLQKVKNGYMVIITIEEIMKFLNRKDKKTLKRLLDSLKEKGLIFTYYKTTKGPECEKAVCLLLRRICPPELQIEYED